MSGCQICQLNGIILLKSEDEEIKSGLLQNAFRYTWRIDSIHLFTRSESISSKYKRKPKL